MTEAEQIEAAPLKPVEMAACNARTFCGFMSDDLHLVSMGLDPYGSHLADAEKHLAVISRHLVACRAAFNAATRASLAKTEA